MFLFCFPVVETYEVEGIPRRKQSSVSGNGSLHSLWKGRQPSAVQERSTLYCAGTGASDQYSHTQVIKPSPSLSMGGLLAADTLLEVAKSCSDSRAPLWPRIIACIAFDTPVRIPFAFNIVVATQSQKLAVSRHTPICIQE
jgi:hypothetical protein